MSAEDLDKLFRDKLKNRPVAPSNDAWERLQARMQAPVQQEAPPLSVTPSVQEPQEERSPIRMWYYSAAAAVTMLLSVGLWVNRENIDPLQPSGAAVATVQEQTPGASTTPITKKAPEQAPVEANSNLSGTPAAASPEVMASVSSLVKETATSKTEPTLRVAPAQKTTRQTTPVQITSEPVMVAAVSQPQPTRSASNAADEPKPLEIIVKLDDAQATASLAHASTTIETTTQEEETPSGSGRVLKGILKQVKNLKDGEKVNLAELGITKHTYALETRIGNKKITKTIEL